jgi:hypothetical protein
VRLLPSPANNIVATRVESVWKARIIMSHMSAMCSSKNRRDAGRRIHVQVHHGHTLRFFDALLDLAHAGQILVELLPVASVQFSLHRVRVLQNKIQDGMLLRLAALHVLDALTR